MKVIDTPAGLWNRLGRFTKGYAYPPGPSQHFRLLLSQRSAGRPAFACLDPKEGLQAGPSVNADFYAWSSGSGTAAVRDHMQDFLANRVKTVKQLLIKELKLAERQVQALLPYFVCLWLSELSLTFEGSWLAERYGVGGVFHFIRQTPTGEDFNDRPFSSLVQLTDRIRR